MKIVLLGSGNAAFALGHLCHRAGHAVRQVFGRNPATTAELATALESTPVYAWDQIERNADLYIAALPDRLIPELHHYFTLQKGMVVHTAGSVPMAALQPVACNHGVLYPLQSIHRKLPFYSHIPLLIDGNTPDDCSLIQDFAATLSGNVTRADDETRLKLHMAAVWVNNFTNHLYTIAWAYCRHEGLDARMLLPLIEHTATRLQYLPPDALQTGPAIRNDVSTMERHLALLAGDPEAAALYRQLSAAISAWYSTHPQP